MEMEENMAELIWLRKAYDDGWHNAFTDLVCWRGMYYICFRNSISHVGKDGKVVVVAGSDLKNWKRVAVPINTIGDDRDPHMIATEERLYVFSGTWMIRKGEKINVGTVPLLDCWSFCSYTEDGETWSDPVCLYGRNHWLWSPVLIGDTFYCVSELGGGTVEDRDSWNVQLLRSKDALTWEFVSSILDHDRPNETAIRMKPDGTMQALIRAQSESAGSFIGESKAPYTDWEIIPIDTVIQSPEFVQVGDAVYVGGRSREQDPDNSDRQVSRMSVWRMAERDVEHVITLPSGGDTSYPGMIAQEDGSILISYYSQHEVMNREGFKRAVAPSNIYLASVKVS